MAAPVFSECGILNRKANLMIYTFSAADPAVKSHLLQSYCLSLYGSALWKLPFTQSRSLLTTYSDASGIFNAIATPEFYTLLLACPVCLMLSFLGQHPFCQLPSPALLALIVRKVFSESSLLAYTHTGYNAMSGGLHAMQAALPEG